MLKKIEEFKERLQSIDDEAAGILKIAAPNIIAQYYLPNAIREFKKLRPKVRSAKEFYAFIKSNDFSSFLQLVKY